MKPDDCSECGAELTLRPDRCPLCGATRGDRGRLQATRDPDAYQRDLRALKDQLKALRDGAEAV